MDAGKRRKLRSATAVARDAAGDERKNSKGHNFTRLWIYSHHIYSKIKRKDLLTLASNYRLSGFSMPGKPGIICLEGRTEDCSMAWSEIKSWNWKKIQVREQEEEKCDSFDQVESLRRFDGFSEVGFVKNSDTRDYHMDMGDFHTFLQDHNCGYMFEVYFGIAKE